ncbi:MAG: hypothetical protein IT371_04515 [Deltaproteobacteria bacterium]|nr:hypothetical protein [Deltaproteobacteria bacterium]
MTKGLPYRRSTPWTALVPAWGAALGLSLGLSLGPAPAQAIPRRQSVAPQGYRPEVWERATPKQRLKVQYTLLKQEQRRLTQADQRFRATTLKQARVRQLAETVGNLSLAREVDFSGASPEAGPWAGGLPFLTGVAPGAMRPKILLNGVAHHIQVAAQVLSDLASAPQRTARGESYFGLFNGTPLVARPGDSVRTILRRYWRSQDREPSFGGSERLSHVYSQLHTVKMEFERLVRPSLLSSKRMGSLAEVRAQLEPRARKAGYRDWRYYGFNELRGGAEIKAFVAVLHRAHGDAMLRSLASFVGHANFDGTDALWRAAIAARPGGEKILARDRLERTLDNVRWTAKRVVDTARFRLQRWFGY